MISHASASERYHGVSASSTPYEHLHRYGMCLALAEGLDVLDVASGQGYGTALLASRAKRAIGVDIDARAVEHAKHRYYRQNLRYLVGDCAALPLSDDSVDLVVSFETIEHTKAHDQFLAEIDRVLRPGGRVVISSRNRLVCSDETGYADPQHIGEMYYDQFAELLQRNFSQVRIYGQRLATASFVFPLADETDAALSTLSVHGSAVRAGLDPLTRPMYFVAVCSDTALSENDLSSLFVDPADDILETLRGEYDKRLHEALEATRSEQAALEAHSPLRLSGERDSAVSQALQAAVMLQRTLEAQLATAQDERAAAAGESQAARAELTRLAVELASSRAEHARVLAERDDIVAERDDIDAELALVSRLRADDLVRADSQQAALERAESFHAELEAVGADRDRFAHRADGLARELANLRERTDQLVVELQVLLRERAAFSGIVQRALELQRLLEAQVGCGAMSDAGAAVAPEGRVRHAERLYAELERRCGELERSLAEQRSAFDDARWTAEREERVRARQTERLRENCAALERRCGELDRLLSEQQSRPADEGVREELERAQAALEAALGQAQRDREALADIVGSRSWRLTLPLRRLARGAKGGGR